MKNNNLLNIFYCLPQNFGKIFQAKYLLWHALSISLTFICVFSELDWKYYKSTQIPSLQAISFFAVILGFILPIFLPVALLIFGKIKKNSRSINTAFALVQAEGLAWLTSACYKAITGRPGPMENINNLVDISHVFRFGLLRGGIFWGWPSSHTTVAFATAITLLMLYPKNKSVKYFGLIYAIYIGIGVSMSIHWFSDFIAGIIFGSLAGFVVGKSFLEKYKHEKT